MSALALALRLLTLLVLARLAVRFVGGLLVGLQGQPDARELVRDRVCNTFIPRASAITATVAGREEHFCSAACRDRARTLLPAP